MNAVHGKPPRGFIGERYAKRSSFTKGSSSSSKTTFLSVAMFRATRIRVEKATFSIDEKVKDNMVKPHGRLVVVD